jgi:hypothetical protein
MYGWGLAFSLGNIFNTCRSDWLKNNTKEPSSSGAVILYAAAAEAKGLEG